VLEYGENVVVQLEPITRPLPIEISTMRVDHCGPQPEPFGLVPNADLNSSDEPSLYLITLITKSAVKDNAGLFP
jgi:hypothetical protein